MTSVVLVLDRSFFCNVWEAEWLIHYTPRHQLLWFGVSWFLALVLVALWNCYCSLHPFSDLAYGLYCHFTCKLLLTNLLDWRCVADVKSISTKANGDQIRLRHPCGVLMLKHVVVTHLNFDNSVVWAGNVQNSISCTRNNQDANYQKLHQDSELWPQWSGLCLGHHVYLE